MSNNMSDGQKPVIFLLHGIMSRGIWCDEAAVPLQNAGFTVRKLDYGNFSPFQLASKKARNAKIKWLHDRLYPEQLATQSTATPSIIAHSFGTYMIANMIKQFDDKETFDKVIFCGSIVNQDFDWGKLCRKGVVNKVLNQFGGLDFWARIVSEVVRDAGAAGYAGFNDDADGRVLQQGKKHFKHGDYFYARNYADNWVTFLKDGDLEPSDHRPAPLPLTRTILATTLFTTAIIAGTYAATVTSKPVTAVVPPPPPPPQALSEAERIEVVQKTLMTPLFNDRRRALFLVREDAAVIPIHHREDDMTGLSLSTFPPEFENEIEKVIYESEGFATPESEHKCEDSPDSRAGARVSSSAADHFKVSWEGRNVKQSVVAHIFLKKPDKFNANEYTIAFSMNGIKFPKN